MRSRNLLLLVSAFVLISCSGRSADARLVPEETFVRLYADVLVVREESLLRGAGAVGPSLPDSLSRVYGIEGADFDYTLKAYQADLTKWKHLHEKVVQRLELLQQEMASKRVHR